MFFKKWRERFIEERERREWGETTEKIASEDERRRVDLRRVDDRKKAIFSTEEVIADLVATNRMSIRELQAIKTKNIRLTEQVCLLREVITLFMDGKPEEAIAKNEEVCHGG